MTTALAIERGKMWIESLVIDGASLVVDTGERQVKLLQSLEARERYERKKREKVSKVNAVSAKQHSAVKLEKEELLR